MASVKTPLDPIEIGGIRYQLQYKGPDVTEEGRQKLTQIAARQLQAVYAKNPDLSPLDISRITQRNVSYKSGIIKPKDPAEWAEVRTVLQEESVEIEIPDGNDINDPDDQILKEHRGRVTFNTVEEPHYLDGIQYDRIPMLEGENRADYIRRVTRNLAGSEYDPAKAKTRDSLVGVAMSSVKQKNYQMHIELLDHMRNFFGREYFTSSEILAHNGLTPGSCASSFNRYAGVLNQVTLMRSIEADDLSVDCLAGRVYNLESAEDMTRFAFLSQMNLYRHKDTAPALAAKAQGIRLLANGEFEFEFAVQSLLPMIPGGERNMFLQEAEGYRLLEEKYRNQPLLIQDPQDPAKVYRVYIRPIPIAAEQFNYMNTLEKILPDALSGKLDAQEQTRHADEMLFQRTAEKLPSYNIVRQTQINDTIYFLKSGELKPWQEALARAYLCHLLDIPIIFHCKSSVDRTNAIVAPVTAMKQWIRSGKEIPKRGLRYAIFDLAKVKYDVIDEAGKRKLNPKTNRPYVFYPFKELVAYNMHKGLKITKSSRGKYGYKYNRGAAQHPGLQDLLPSRYLVKRSRLDRWVMTNLKAAGLIVAGMAAYLIPPIVFQILATIGLLVTLGLKSVYHKARSWIKGIPNKDKSGRKLAKKLEKIWPQYKLWTKGKKLKAVETTIGLFCPALILATGYSISKYCTVRPKWWGAKALVYGLGTPLWAPLKLIANARKPFVIRQIKERYTKVAAHSLLHGQADFDLFDLENSDS